jgi:primosomal protein N' (replication factor Y)
MAVAVAACVDSGRGALLCFPDRRDVARADEALAQVLGPGRHVVLTAELGPAARYRAFLAASRGRVPVVIGTRAAAFAPVSRLGLLAIWDDGDDLHAEPRAPYPHVREVLALRAHQQGAALLLAGHARTAEAQLLVNSGWLTTVAAPRDTVRRSWPAVQVTGGESAQMDRDPGCPRRAAAVPGARRGAHRSARGPRALPGAADRLPGAPGLSGLPDPGGLPGVLRAAGADRAGAGSAVSVVRPGGVAVAVQRVWQRAAARPRCWANSAPPRSSAGRSPECQYGARPASTCWTTVPAEPAVVVATPGAEPRAAGGYLVGVLLDTAVALARPDLRAVEESVRRWTSVAALVRPRGDGGVLVVVGEPAQPSVQALVRGDPAGFAERELAGRRAARMPPAARIATIEGPVAALRPLTDPAVVQRISGSGWPQPVQVLGPAPLAEGRARLVVRVPRAAGAALARTLATLQADRSARKTEPLRVVVDPAELG